MSPRADGIDTGGGLSLYEPEPSYQDSVQSTGYRSTPDVSFDADPNTGVSVYVISPNSTSGQGQWEVFGGTSVGAPSWAGIIAIIDQGRALAGQASLSSATQTLPTLYSAPSTAFNKVAETTSQRSWRFGGGGLAAAPTRRSIQPTIIPRLASAHPNGITLVQTFVPRHDHDSNANPIANARRRHPRPRLLPLRHQHPRRLPRRRLLPLRHQRRRLLPRRHLLRPRPPRRRLLPRPRRRLLLRPRRRPLPRHACPRRRLLLRPRRRPLLRPRRRPLPTRRRLRRQQTHRHRLRPRQRRRQRVLFRHRPRRRRPKRWIKSG